MEIKLVVVAGEAPAAEYSVQLPATVGRSRMADIRVGHPLVSRKHCELFATDDGMLMIRDMGSLNGTFVGEARIGQPMPLPPGAVITVGAVKFQAVYGKMPQVETAELETPHMGGLDATADVSHTNQTLELGESDAPATEPAPAASGDGDFDLSWLADPADVHVPHLETQPMANSDSRDLPFPNQAEAASAAADNSAGKFSPPEKPDDQSDEDDGLSDFLASLK